MVPSLPWPEVATGLAREGFIRALHEGTAVMIDTLTARAGDTLEIVVDRLVLKPDGRARLVGSLEQALRYGKGRMWAWRADTG